MFEEYEDPINSNANKKWKSLQSISMQSEGRLLRLVLTEDPSETGSDVYNFFRGLDLA